MGSRNILFFAALLTAAVLGGWAFRQHQRIARLGAALTSLEARQEQANRLLKEHQRLAAALANLGDLTSLRRASGQAARARANVERLKLQARNLALATTPKGHPLPPIWPKDAVVLPANEWKFSGNDSPGSALESVLWAAREGEVDRLAALIDLRPGDRERADQFLAALPPETRAQYGTPENLVATLVAANMPTDFPAVAPYNDVEGSEQALMKLRIEQASGQQQDLSFMFHHNEAGWRLDVPGNVIAGFEQQLKSK